MKKANRYLAQRLVSVQEELEEVKRITEAEIISLQFSTREMKRKLERYESKSELLEAKVDKVHLNQQGANAHMGWINRMIFNLTGKSYRPHAGRDVDVDLDVKAVEVSASLPNKLT